VGDWTPVGEVVLLQIQRTRLVRDQQYDPQHIVRADRLRLTPDGVFGLVDGAWIRDRHHRRHPDARNWNKDRVLSVGFTSHYLHMWELFRPTPLGSAGENLVVEADDMIGLSDISGGVRIDSEHGVIEIRESAVAEPCVGFTRFMTQRPRADAAALKSERQKLRKGVRGFVMGLGGVGRMEISPGDKLSIRGA